jgi:hypothetical protein
MTREGKDMTAILKKLVESDELKLEFLEKEQVILQDRIIQAIIDLNMSRNMLERARKAMK